MNSRLKDSVTLRLQTNSDINFGNYRWVPGCGLYRGNARVPLPPKEQAVLEFLISLRGEAATHSEIENAVWPQQQVGYGSLARCIYSLRKRLDAGDTMLIETLPRRGYRLAAEMTTCPDKPCLAREKAVLTSSLAYSHFQAGLRDAEQPTRTSLARAIDRLEAAIAVDPAYAPAFAACADVRMYQILRGDLSPSKGLALGLAACQRALALDAALAPAIAVRGWFHGIIEKDLNAGLDMLDAAQRLDPEYARLYVYRAWLLRAAGEAHASLEATRAAISIDPHSLLGRHAHAWSLFLAGRADEGLALEQVIAEDIIEDFVAHIYSGVFAAFLGRHEFARSCGELAMAWAPETPTVWALMAYIHARAGRDDDARALAARSEQCRDVLCTPGHLAPVYVALGDPAKAQSILKRGVREGCPWAHTSRLDPRLSPLFASVAPEILLSD